MDAALAPSAQEFECDLAPDRKGVCRGASPVMPRTQITVHSMQSVRAFPPDEELGEELVRRLRQKLDAKRRQYRLHHPYVLILKAGDGAIQPGIVLRLACARIFPNRLYRWVSGILYIDYFMDTEKGYLIKRAWVANEHADAAVPEAFVRRVAG